MDWVIGSSFTSHARASSYWLYEILSAVDTDDARMRDIQRLWRHILKLLSVQSDIRANKTTNFLGGWHISSYCVSQGDNISQTTPVGWF